MLRSVQVRLDRDVPSLNKTVTIAITIAMLNINDFRKYVEATKFKLRSNNNIKRTAKVPDKLLEEFLKEFNISLAEEQMGTKTLLVSLAVQYCIDKYPRFLHVISLLSSRSSSNSSLFDEFDIKVPHTIVESAIDRVNTESDIYSENSETTRVNIATETNKDEELIMKWWWGVVVPYNVRKKKQKSKWKNSSFKWY